MTKVDEKTNSGFIFGLSLGAAIGALTAVLIHKNNDPKIIKNFESKIKDFFQDLINDVKTKKEEREEVVKEIKEVEYITPKKPAPKMFVKQKK